MVISNNNSPNVATLLIRLFRHISGRRRRQFMFLLGLTVATSLAEVISLSAVLPFIGIITQPDQVFSQSSMTGLVKAIGFTSGAELVIPLTVGFAVAALIAGGLRLLLLWVSIRLGNAIGADLSIEVYCRTLYQPYSVHVARSSGEIISGITQKVGTATSVLISGVAVVTSTLLFAAILSTLLAIDPLVAVIASGTFGSAYVALARLTRHRLVQNSQCIAKEQTQVVKSLQEGLGAIRDVLLDGTQKVYSNVYRKAIVQLQLANGENNFINQAPRYAMEALGMVLIALFVLGLSNRPGGVSAALPILAMLALGAQRLLPLLQQLYGNWSVVMGSKTALADVLALLDQPLPVYAYQQEPEPLEFIDYIQIEKLSFRYQNEGSWILDDINLKIRKGERIGFVGSTGSGKSTALDLVMGLLEPTRGQILVDGQPISHDNRRAWQKIVAHVPQNIYLADASVAENIAFGVPKQEIDLERMRRAAKQARIAEFVESKPQGYGAIVGERGISLSGGQRQRIAIARAIYKQASVLIFDEATSALDAETELSVMESIDKLDANLTILIIAHRVTTLKNCNMIFKLEKSKVVGKYTYDQLKDIQNSSKVL